MSTDRSTWTSWDRILEESLQDPAFREEWERTALARVVATRVIRYRIDNDLTQTALARMLGMRQPAISRLEIGETNPSWEMLIRLSDVLGIEFLVDIAPQRKGSRLLGPALRRAEKIDRIARRGARVTVATT
jgi:transcriptional regulator with XRE-family HTH domain